MDERKPEELAEQLENAEVTELDEESLEDVAGGSNGNCGNSNCCKPPALEGVE
jgi:hypothetical protein